MADGACADAPLAVQLLAASAACAAVRAIARGAGAGGEGSLHTTAVSCRPTIEMFPPPRLDGASLLRLPLDASLASCRAAAYRATAAPLLPRLIEPAQECGFGTAGLRASQAEVLAAVRELARVEEAAEVARVREAKRQRTAASHLERLGVSPADAARLRPERRG